MLQKSLRQAPPIPFPHAFAVSDVPMCSAGQWMGCRNAIFGKIWKAIGAAASGIFVFPNTTDTSKLAFTISSENKAFTVVTPR